MNVAVAPLAAVPAYPIPVAVQAPVVLHRESAATWDTSDSGTSPVPAVGIPAPARWLPKTFGHALVTSQIGVAPSPMYPAVRESPMTSRWAMAVPAVALPTAARNRRVLSG